MRESKAHEIERSFGDQQAQVRGNGTEWCPYLRGRGIFVNLAINENLTIMTNDHTIRRISINQCYR